MGASAPVTRTLWRRRVHGPRCTPDLRHVACTPLTARRARLLADCRFGLLLWAVSAVDSVGCCALWTGWHSMLGHMQLPCCLLKVWRSLPRDTPRDARTTTSTWKAVPSGRDDVISHSR